MAKLHRMVRLDDRGDTSIFSFLTPCGPLLNTNALQDSFDSDFDHGNHRWVFSVVRSNAHVDLFIYLKFVSEHMNITLDIGFTLINQDHYTRNEKGRLLRATYNSQNFKHGLKNFCALQDLEKGRFKAEQGADWFVVEVEMKHLTSIFEQTLKLETPIDKSHFAKQQDKPVQPKIETSYFSFGNFDWSLLLFPRGDSPEAEGNFVCSICRHSSFDNICKIKYEVSVEMMTSTTSSSSSVVYQSDGVIESIVDAYGRTKVPHPLGKLNTLTNKSRELTHMRVRLILKSCSAIGEGSLKPFVPGKNRVRLYDREEQAWTVESDVSMSRLMFRLFYDDVAHVPRGHVRRVTWSLSIVPVTNDMSEVDVLKRGNIAVGGVRACYYVQLDADDGQTIVTDIPTAELKHSGVYAEAHEGGMIQVQLDWIDSHLLFMDKWQLSDDVIFKQRHQMRQELATLEAENLSLEKQLHHLSLNNEEKKEKNEFSLSSSKRSLINKSVGHFFKS